MSTLFSTIDDFNQFFTLDANFNFALIKPSIEAAQNTYIKKLIGAELLERLLTGIEDDDLNAEESALLLKIKAALAPISVFSYTDIGNITFTESGMHTLHNENQKPAFEWQVQRFKNTVQDIAYTNFDLLLEFLESNATDFPLWTDSTAYTLYNATLIRTAAEFQLSYNINSSRLVFMALLPKMQYVEDLEISSVLCTYYAELLEKQIAETLTASDKIILPYLKKAIARLTIAIGLVDLSIEANVFGVIKHESTGTSTYKGFKPADDKSMQLVVVAAEREGRQYLDKVLKIIYADIANYPTFAASPCYVEDSSSSTTGNLDEMRPKVYDSFFRT